jgi:methyl-accepting chemotaxis protein
MLNNLRLGTRLALGFGAIIVAMVTAFAAAAWMGRQNQAELTRVVQDAKSRTELVQHLREAQLSLVSTIRNAGLQSDGGLLNAEVATFHALLKEMRAHEEVFAKLDLDAQEKAALDAAIALRSQAEPVAAEAIKFTMAFAGEEAAKLLTTTFTPLQARWAASLRHLVELTEQRSVADIEAIRAAGNRQSGLVALLLGAVVLAGVWFAVAVTRSVTRPLRTAVGLASQVAGGDLAVSIQVHGQDETAELLRSLQSMAAQLSTMVLSVRSASESIAVASEQITRGNMDLSSRTERQAASVQETSSTMEALTGMVGQTSGNAVQARELAERTATIAAESGQAMKEVEQTMGGISDSSRRIGDIIGVIDGIAFQTNILALNAAVEAARAGEQGRGFAVVASEVRALAQRVSSAASEVRGLIGDSAGRVETGSQLVGRMAQTMQELVLGVDQVRTLIGEISTASNSQSGSIAQANGSVQEIDQTTQQNAALVEEVAAAAQSLSGQTRRLGELMQRFRVAQTA